MTSKYRERALQGAPSPKCDESISSAVIDWRLLEKCTIFSIPVCVSTLFILAAKIQRAGVNSVVRECIPQKEIRCYSAAAISSS